MKSIPSVIRAALGTVVLLVSIGSGAWAQAAKNAASEARRPRPDLADVSYGPHARNVLDLWKAKSAQPTPLVVFIHGGGFRQGDKDRISPALIQGLVAEGISVMAVNYRLSPEVSFPAHYMDCARAIQFARARAKEWNIDPKRIGATGSSAGAGTSLWIGFHDDMADPNNRDPVLRESTRLACMAVMGAQSSYDPRDITKWVSAAAAAHEALPGFFGVKREDYDTPRAHKIFEAASAINYLTRDDPPVYAFYSERRDWGPAPKAGQGIHHINLGYRLKEKMDALGIECTVRHADEGAESVRESIDFFARHLLKRSGT